MGLTVSLNRRRKGRAGGLASGKIRSLVLSPFAYLKYRRSSCSREEDLDPLLYFTPGLGPKAGRGPSVGPLTRERGGAERSMPGSARWRAGAAQPQRFGQGCNRSGSCGCCPDPGGGSLHSNALALPFLPSCWDIDEARPRVGN